MSIEKDLYFGHISNISIGDTFKSRMELSKARIHGPSMGGIWGRELEGSCSIVLSGGYEDDIDNLDYILYTGQGGQDIPGGKQVADQEFTKGNKGLQISCDYELKVRVTRGYQIKNGPEEGYRYDGLYHVTSYERIVGKSGFKICRFHLESEFVLKDLENKLENTLRKSYESVGRTKTTINKLNRNVRNREIIKRMYDSRCQVCGVFLKKPDNNGIAIGAHVKALGKPHEGPDVIENMLCLCPNHHAQFDAYSFFIHPENLTIHGIESLEGDKLKIIKQHKIDKEFISYHMNLYKKRN